jgi:hypothetical protein
MDDDDIVIEAFGVLLTQLRTARRALENIDRNTSTYSGFEFARALTQRAEFGQPPMFQGALMVHVVNIDDLAPGNGFGGFVEALLGGIGNFFSNLVGGLVGSFLTSWKLPEMLESLRAIVADVKDILRMIGVGQGDKNKSDQAKSGSSESFLTTLDGIRTMIREVTALFTAASSGPEAAAQTSQTPITKTGEAWMAILDGVNRLLDRATHLVDGLVLLIPNVVGGLSFLLANLGRLRDEMLLTVQFVLRNVLVLRGVVLTVIFETVASAARLATSVVGILATTIEGLIGSIAAVVRELLGAVFDALKVLADGLRAIVTSILKWLVDGIVQTLRVIGDLPIFRTIDHLIRILPALIGPIYALMNKGAALPGGLQKNLDTAFSKGFAPGATTPTSSTKPAPVTIGKFPDLNEIIDPVGATLTSAVDATADGIKGSVAKTFDSVGGALGDMSTRFDKAAKDEAGFSRKLLEGNVGTITKNADALTQAITKPVGADQGPTGLEAIAKAYESWLTTGGGLRSLLGEIEKHFSDKPPSGEPGGQLGLLRGQFDRPRATIDIDEVEIVIDTATDATPPATDSAPTIPGLMTAGLTDEDIYRAWLRYTAELDDRGVHPTDLATALT